MITKDVFERFLIRTKLDTIGLEQKARLEYAFKTLDDALDFESMDETKLHRFNKAVDWLVSLPVESDSNSRAPFYRAVSRAQSALEALASTEFPWGHLDASLVEQIKFVGIELSEYAETKGSWGNGGPTKLGKMQEIGLSLLHRKLKKSQRDYPDRWRELELEEHGIFKSPHVNATGLTSATPGRVLANLCAAMGLDLHEAGVDHVVEKDVLSKGSLQLEDD